MTTSKKSKAGAADIVTSLERSKIYQDYEQAFTQASGLPLILKAPLDGSSNSPWLGGNQFCEYMARKHQACAECLALQKRIERNAEAEPSTMKCFAGMCESAVPVRVGSGVVAFLETGHVFLTKPDRGSFNRLARTLLNLGTEIDLKKAEEAWFATRVLKPEQYEAFLRMLHIFAQHLGASHSGLVMRQEKLDAPNILRAKQYISKHADEELTLGKVARVVNLSAHHLCKKFKQCTGISFTSYVTRVRVEKASLLIRGSGRRVNEICYDAGFRSLSQFNRAFKQVVGCSPREYRRRSS